MRLPLTLARDGRTDVDIVVSVEAGTTVGDIADQIQRCDPAGGAVSRRASASIRVEGTRPRTVDRALPVESSGLHPGARISLASTGERYSDESAPVASVAKLVVLSGPDIGREFPLKLGANQVGRAADNDVQLTDQHVSKYHARINISDQVEVIDLQSSNGIIVDDERVDRVQLRRDQCVLIGDTLARVDYQGGADALRPFIDFNRSPRLDPEYGGREFIAPEPPSPPQPGRFPFVPLLVPLLLVPIMLKMLPKGSSKVFLIFLALSPLMAIGAFADQRIGGRRAFKRETKAFRDGLAELATELEAAAGAEQLGRRHEHPSAGEAAQAANDRSPLLWTRRPGERGYLELRLGLGALPSRDHVRLPGSNKTTPELWHELLAVPLRFALTPGVPIVANFHEHGGLGIAGPRNEASHVLHSVVTQLAALHSPAQLALAAIAPPATAREWDWMKWLPHVASDHSPIAAEQLASSPRGIEQLLAAIEELIDQRAAVRRNPDQGPIVPSIVLVVDDAAAEDRSRLTAIAESGPRVGVHVVWFASRLENVPAACRVYVDTEGTTPLVGIITDQLAVQPIEPDQMQAAAMPMIARLLAPVVDAGAPRTDDLDVPSIVPYLELVGLDAGSSRDWVVERWRANHTLPSEFSAKSSRKARSELSAIVGKTSPLDPFRIDLRNQGPHALVGGTTGAGKSEFLQTWVSGLALEYSPARITFLFVDYKGGSAFAACATLPHTVGLVTDLNPHLVTRALTSLHAELRYRERLLEAKRAKDVLELERRGDVDTPPCLVIVVDEFAALVSELPEFVEGVVNVAQRGRSLGLHLILATQRPKGVIKDNLRANTNLRVALRVADEDDSTDVVNSSIAAGFDPAIPGRGVAKAGPGRLTPFQTGYVGGWSTKVAVKPPIQIGELEFGSFTVWEPPPDEVAEQPQEESLGPTDLEMIVENIRGAAHAVGLENPRKPWLPALAAVYDLGRLRQSRTDAELVFAVVDKPEQQQQGVAAFFPDRDGAMAIYGTGGTGKTTILRTLAVEAGLTSRGGPCHVYGIDCGTRGLQVLEELPHVGSIINGEDEERIARLLRKMRAMINERSRRFAARNVGTIDAYRKAANEPDEPRVVLMIDGFSKFRQDYEATRPAFLDLLQQIAADGRQVGLHLVVTADRGATVPPSLGSAIQRRLVLRLANENDYYGVADVDIDALEGAPPGRGFLDGLEVQVAVLGGSADVSRQATAIRRLGDELRRAGRVVTAPPIERLAEHIQLAALPAATSDGRPVFGVADETLEPFGFVPGGAIIVTGPGRSGRTTAVATLTKALVRARDGVHTVLLSTVRSPLAGALAWDELHSDVEDIGNAADALVARLNKAPGGQLVVVMEGYPELAGSLADAQLETLVKACRSDGATVIAEGETSTVMNAYGALASTLKSDRHGFALQPEQTDGDILFKTSFPKVNRAAFPPGRGLYVLGGRAYTVQCAEGDA